MEEICQLAHARIDLLGGTLDFWPIDLLTNGLVLNAAINLAAKVQIKKNKNKKVISVLSKDYDTTCELSLEGLENYQYPENFSFVGRIVREFLPYINKNQDFPQITISCSYSAGSGLGGSSAMGIALYKGLLRYFEMKKDRKDIIKAVQDIEAIILERGPAGYQDYYPACYGGILALKSNIGGVEIEQKYSPEFTQFLSKHLLLIDSCQTRNSGVNNWEVYKGFFDGQQEAREGLYKIAELGRLAYESIQNLNYQLFLEQMAQEGELRISLFPKIMTTEQKVLIKNLRELEADLGHKICGAGGGGHLCLLHSGKNLGLLTSAINKMGFKVKEFKFVEPIDDFLGKLP